MAKEKLTVGEYYLQTAKEAMGVAVAHVGLALSHLEHKKQQLKPVYRTPQWHHTVLWTGFAFIVGMLLGACLMSL